MMSQLKPLPATVTVSLEGEAPRTVLTERYVHAKTKALKEFGYGNLLASTVREQLQHALAGHTMEQGLDVIGMFIERDLVKE